MLGYRIMGKDTVVIRSVVTSTVKQPFLSMPDKVKQYFCKNYGDCEVVYYTSSYQGQQTRYVVVLRFSKGDIANRIKQKYNGRPLSGARVTTSWLDQKNMKDLGITEDMVYSDLVQTVRNDSYGKSGGKKSWTGRYQGGRRKIGARERESSSSSHYDKEPSRSLSPPRHVVDHNDIASTVGSTSLVKFYTETENSDSQEYPSSSMYGTRREDTDTCQERPLTQDSDNSSLIEKEGSLSVSLSQVSHGTRDSIYSNGKKRQLILGEGSQLHTKKQREGESDDTVFKGKGKLKTSSLKSGYSRRQLVDRRSRGSPKRGGGDYSDDEMPKQDHKYSSRNENLSLQLSCIQTEATANAKVTQVDDVVNQIHPVDICSNFPKVPNELVKQEPLHLDYDQVESQTSVQLDTRQTEPKTRSSCENMSCTPPISTFDFERDETPPAEIVEATAEWCRTQNLPPNFSSVSLQHVFQYYQSSLAVDGTKNKNEGGLWHSPIWSGIFQQRNQPLGENLVATSSGVTNPAYSCQSAFNTKSPNIDPTAQCSSSGSGVQLHFSALSKPVINSSEQTSPGTVLHGVPTYSYSAHEPWSSHLHNTMDRDSRQLSDGEIQEHLKMFLNHQETKAMHSDSVAMHAGVETTSDVTGCIGSEEVSRTARYCRQQGKEAAPAFSLISPSHGGDHNIYVTPESQKEASLISNVTHSGMQQEGSQRSSQHLSNQSYPLNEHIRVHGESGAYRHTLTRDHLPTLGCTATLNSVEEITACIAESGPEGSEPAVNRDQWKEGEHKLSQQHSSKGLWRIEEIGYMQEPLRRERACNQASVDSLYQASSITASQICNDTSCTHKGEVRGLQLQHLNELTAKEPQYCSTLQDGYEEPSQVENHHSDLTSSPLSGNQHTDIDRLRMSSSNFHRRQQQRLNTERSSILPMSMLKTRSMYTPLQELSKLNVNPVSGDDNGYDLCVPQRTLNDPNKQDQPQRLQCEQLAEKDMDGAEELLNKILVQDRHESMYTEQSHDRGSDGAESTTQISGIDMQTKKRKLIAHKYKHLQKYYYKEFCEQAVILAKSTKLLSCQNPGSKSMLVTNLQSSLEQIGLHLKDKFWYQVELGEESAMVV